MHLVITFCSGSTRLYLNLFDRCRILLMYPALQVADYYTAVRFGYFRDWWTKPTSNEFSLQLAVLIWISNWLSKRLLLIRAHSAQLSCYSSYGTREHLTFFPSVMHCFPLHHAIPSDCSKSYFILFSSCIWSRNLRGSWLRWMNSLLKSSNPRLRNQWEYKALSSPILKWPMSGDVHLLLNFSSWDIDNFQFVYFKTFIKS